MTENNNTKPLESIEQKMRYLAETDEDVLKLFPPLEQEAIRCIKEYVKKIDEKSQTKEKLIKS